MSIMKNLSLYKQNLFLFILTSGISFIIIALASLIASEFDESLVGGIFYAIPFYLIIVFGFVFIYKRVEKYVEHTNKITIAIIFLVLSSILLVALNIIVPLIGLYWYIGGFEHSLEGAGILAGIVFYVSVIIGAIWFILGNIFGMLLIFKVRKIK